MSADTFQQRFKRPNSKFRSAMSFPPPNESTVTLGPVIKPDSDKFVSPAGGGIDHNTAVFGNPRQQE